MTSIKAISEKISKSSNNKANLSQSTLYSRLLKLNKTQDIKLNKMSDTEIDDFVQKHQNDIFDNKEVTKKTTNTKVKSVNNKQKVTTSQKEDKPTTNKENSTSKETKPASAKKDTAKSKSTKKDVKPTSSKKVKSKKDAFTENAEKTVKYPKEVYDMKDTADNVHNHLSLSTIYKRFTSNWKPSKIINKPAKNNNKATYFKVKTENKEMSLKKWLKRYYKKHKVFKRTKQDFNDFLLALKLKANKKTDDGVLSKKQAKTLAKKEIKK